MIRSVAPSPVWAPGDMPAQSILKYWPHQSQLNIADECKEKAPGLVCLQEQLTVADVMARKLPSTLTLSISSFTFSSFTFSSFSGFLSPSRVKHWGQPWPQESSRREEGEEVGVYLVVVMVDIVEMVLMKLVLMEMVDVVEGYRNKFSL